MHQLLTNSKREAYEQDYVEFNIFQGSLHIEFDMKRKQATRTAPEQEFGLCPHVFRTFIFHTGEASFCARTALWTTPTRIQKN